MAAMAMERKTAEKKPFEQRWGALAPAVQGRFYRMKCRELLVQPRYSTTAQEESGVVHFMRENMKPMPISKAHPKAEPLMSC